MVVSRTERWGRGGEREKAGKGKHGIGLGNVGRQEGGGGREGGWVEGEKKRKEAKD